MRLAEALYLLALIAIILGGALFLASEVLGRKVTFWILMGGWPWTALLG